LGEYSYREGERVGRDSESSMTLEGDVGVGGRNGKGGFYGGNFSSSEVTLHHSDNPVPEKGGMGREIGGYGNDSQEVLMKGRSSDEFMVDQKVGYQVHDWDHHEEDFGDKKRKDSDVTVVGGSPPRNGRKYSHGGI